MKKFLFVLTLASTLLPLNTYAAYRQAYYGIAFHYGNYDETSYPSANPLGFSAGGGLYVTNSVAVEGRLAMGLLSDTVTIYDPYFGNVNVKIDLKSAVSVFVKGDIPLSRTTNFFGLLGMTQAEIGGSTKGVTVSESDSSLSYGLGGEVAIENDMYIRGEYIMYINNSAYRYSGINIGITKFF